MKTKEYNTRFRERYKDALNAYMNAKMKERYRTMPEIREDAKANARLRHSRNRERKALEAAAVDFNSTIEGACSMEKHVKGFVGYLCVLMNIELIEPNERIALRTCSGCHSTLLMDYFETNRNGKYFKTCDRCRIRKKPI